MQVLPQNGQAELWHWQGTLWHADCKIMINVAICNIWSKNVNWKMIWFVCNQCWISIRQSRLVNWAIRYCNARLLMKGRSRTLKSSIPEIWDNSLPPLRLIVPLLFIAWRTSDDGAQRKCGSTWICVVCGARPDLSGSGRKIVPNRAFLPYVHEKSGCPVR